MQNCGGRCHGIGRIETASRGDSGNRKRFVARQERPTLAREIPFDRQRFEICFRVIVSSARQIHVLIHHGLTFVRERFAQHFRDHVEFQAAQKQQRAQCHGVLHHWLHWTKWFGERADGQRRLRDAFAQRDVAFQLIGIEHHHAAGDHFRRVPLDRILIQRDQHVQMVAVRIDFFLPQSHAQPNVSAANHRLIAVVSADVQAQARCGFRECVARFVQTVSRRTADADLQIAHGQILRKADV